MQPCRVFAEKFFQNGEDRAISTPRLTAVLTVEQNEDLNAIHINVWLKLQVRIYMIKSIATGAMLVYTPQPLIFLRVQSQVINSRELTYLGII